MKLRTRDVLLITMLGIVIACSVANIRLGKPFTMLLGTVAILIIFWQYYWGTRRGDVFIVWASVLAALGSLIITVHHEGLDIVAYPLLAVFTSGLVLLVVVQRIKRGHFGVFSWFSHKGLSKH